jgi:ribonuclease HI
MKQVTLYTDGACHGNPGPGGWGVVLLYGEHRKELHGGEPDTTNNRMEMTAVIEGLKALKTACEVTVYTDSTYVQQGMLSWLAGWKAKGWRTAAKQPVKNADLWKLLDAEAARHKVRWEWVKGHAGHPGNERADALASEGAREAGRDASRA